MNNTWNHILWGQLGAAIEMLENAVNACPDELWSDPSARPEWNDHGVPGFWYLVYHTLFFLDMQFWEGEARFTPPAPFDLRELDPAGLLPERPYTKEELRSYLHHCRSKGREAVLALTEESAQRSYRHGSTEMSFVESLIYSLRHVQHHAGQLNLLLRQNGIPAPRWVGRAD